MSGRGRQSLVDESDVSKDNTTTVKVVFRSGFDQFRGELKNTTVQLMNALGTKLDKFPGTKLIVLPEDSKSNHIAFLDDELPIAKLNVERILSELRPNKTYSFYHADGSHLNADLANKLCHAHSLRSYKFAALGFKKKDSSTITPSVLIWPRNADRKVVLAMSRAFTLYKDLVDSPALSLGPADLAATAAAIASEMGANKVEVTVGVDDLKKRGFPQVAAVGMASTEFRQPRVVDFSWSPLGIQETNKLPLVVVVGKGVCFDTGGLNIKGAGMRSMKKDMAGAAQALALSYLIMEHSLNVRLRVLLPCVENSISGVALRPGDVIAARNGITTEISNTDAEGRLILADCLVAACEGVTNGEGEQADQNCSNMPALVIDFATLTGAARVALGTELPALFSNNHTELMKFFELSQAPDVQDPIWPMPLYAPYKSMLKSNIADMVNAADGAGAITAALYLSEFVSPLGGSPLGQITSDCEKEAGSAEPSTATNSSAGTWFHLDFMGTKAGAAEPQGLRASFEYIRRFLHR